MTATALHPQPAPATRSITILGATGSIGQSTIKLITQSPERFRVAALTARDNAEELARLARQVKPELAVIGNTEKYAALKQALAGTGIRVEAGEDAIIAAAELPSDLVMSAIVGAAGLKPTLAAIRRGASVALANKECLVCAGELVMREAQKHGATLLPVDSEHSAIFQVFDFAQPGRVEKITLTASGGPFRTFTSAQMADVTPEQAVKHPNWAMGTKISIDSATLMNKGLEVIEAYYLFPLREDQIEIVIHPESILHGMVHFIDGSVLAQMSLPDMCTPIAAALAWPGRMPCPAPRLDLAKLGKMTFEVPDAVRFPALRLAREALKAGGCAPAILNAANEIAVRRFLDKQIPFPAIARIVEQTLAGIAAAPEDSLDTILGKDAEARAFADALKI